MYRYLVGIVVVPLLGFTFLDPAADKNRQGNRMFHEGKFEEALEYYREAQVEKPGALELRFNAGDAYFKKNAFQDALREFGHALKSQDPSLLARAYYNLGNVHVRQKKLQQAAEAYKRSLALRTDDLDAKVNLEWVLEKMQEQEKDQQQEQNGNRENDQEQEENRNEQKKEEQNDERNRDQPEQRPNQDPDVNRDQNREREENREQKQGRKQEESGGRQQNQQATESESRSDALSREEAERLLDAMKDREMKSQKYRRLRVYGKRYKGNEW